MTSQASSYASEITLRTIGGAPMTLEEVGGALRFSVKTVRREIMRGRLISARLGGRLMVYPKDFEAYLKKARKGDPCITSSSRNKA